MRFVVKMQKILIVDDDNILRTVLKRYLEKQGYQVKDVNSGSDGLTAFADYQPDLIVSDVAMAQMDGWEFCRTLCSQPDGKLVPFIFLSGRDELEDKIKGHSMGADDYLTKPFEMGELLAKIEGLLERARRIHAEIMRLVQNSSQDNTTMGRVGVEVIGASTTPESEVKVMEKCAPELLTPAEAMGFWEVIQGLTNKEISQHLFISPRTVQTHLSNILGKLELENRGQLIRFAYEKGYERVEYSS